MVGPLKEVGARPAAPRAVSVREVELQRLSSTRAGELTGPLDHARTFDLDPSWTAKEAGEAARFFASTQSALTLATDLAIVRRPDGTLSAVYGPDLRELQTGDQLAARGGFAAEVLQVVRGPSSAKSWLATATVRGALTGIGRDEVDFAKEVIAKPDQWAVLRRPASEEPVRSAVGIVGWHQPDGRASYQVSATSLPHARDVYRVYVDLAADADGLTRVRVMGRGPAFELSREALAANPAASKLADELLAATKAKDERTIAGVMDQLHGMLAPPPRAPAAPRWAPS